MAKIKIRLTTSEPGWGGMEGDIISVSEDRAARWCARGIAELVAATTPPTAAKEEEKKPKEKK